MQKQLRLKILMLIYKRVKYLQKQNKKKAE